jgi:ATP-dependent DNA helicase DinG
LNISEFSPDLLGSHGPLASHITGFTAREQQQEMASRIAAALQHKEILVAEAGTGTGKTFAYLLPAILSNQRVIISTGTRNLQDQLFHKDLPLVQRALGVAIEVALLKGRANYLCLHRFELADQNGYLTSRASDEMQTLRRWISATEDGDIGETPLAEDSTLWPMVTSNSDNCLGSDCEHFEACYLMKARRRAQEAELIVVNHHLLFADWTLRDESGGELLPSAEAYVIDEAHLLPEIASHFFGSAIGSNQLLELARDAVSEELREAGESRTAANASADVEKAVREMRLAFGLEAKRGGWSEVEGLPEMIVSLRLLQAAIDRMAEALATLAPISKGLEACQRRCADLNQRLQQFLTLESSGQIRWYETFQRSFALNITPINIAGQMGAILHREGVAWILTSATLTVGGHFEHYLHRMGISDAATADWPSPFDYPHQAVLYVPEGLPDPSASDYTDQVIAVARPILAASGGRAFLLFTSHRALQRAAELLNDLPWPLLVQGESSRRQLLDQFRQMGNAVLLGTGSFWEGIDVRGEALSCVIIDKLPFASPGDPVMQARIDAMRSRGANPFFDYQLPQAVITLKQGVGRLIRDRNDYGVMVICDPRLINKSYGSIFLHSLPPMTRTRKLEVVERFYRLLNNGELQKLRPAG